MAAAKPEAPQVPKFVSDYLKATKEAKTIDDTLQTQMMIGLGKAAEAYIDKDTKLFDASKLKDAANRQAYSASINKSLTDVVKAVTKSTADGLVADHLYQSMMGFGPLDLANAIDRGKENATPANLYRQLLEPLGESMQRLRQNALARLPTGDDELKAFIEYSGLSKVKADKIRDRGKLAQLIDLHAKYGSGIPEPMLKDNGYM